MSLLNHRDHRVPFEDHPTDEVAELREQRRQLRLLSDEQRRQIARLEREKDELHRELAHAHRELAKPWWRR